MDTCEIYPVIELQSQKIDSQINEIKQELRLTNQKIESLVAENKEIKNTVLQMNATLSMILDYCKFYSLPNKKLINFCTFETYVCFKSIMCKCEWKSTEFL